MKQIRSGVKVESSPERLRVANAHIEFRADLSRGTLSIGEPYGGWRPLPEAFCAVRLEDARLVSTAGRRWELQREPEQIADVHGAGLRAVLSTGPDSHARLHLAVTVYDDHPLALLRLGIENTGASVVRVRELTPLATDKERGGGLAFQSPSSNWRIFRHGWQSWTPSLSLSTAQQDIDARPPAHAPAQPPTARGAFASEELLALLDPTAKRSLVVGFVSAHKQWTQVRLAAGARAIEATATAEGAEVAAGETLWSERLAVDLSGDAQAALARYADALGREMDARVPQEPPSGWCSWYHYFRDVSEADVVKNLRYLEAHREALPLDYVQIDDGYQAEIGDWTTANEKFPHGMAWLAQAIERAGFRPGLWLAPFLVGANSQLFAEHADWVVRDERGAPVVAARNWGQDCYGLDCTHPEAEEWLHDLFREVTDAWGYDYVKIDFLYGGAVAGRRYDPKSSRIEAYRRGLRAIRRGVGERFVLGCGALMGASVGLVDGQRIGPDVAPWWRWNRPTDPPRRRGSPAAGGEPSTENALRNVLTRSWMHGRLWANDPDCLLARETRSKLTRSEVHSLASAIALSGGMVLVSDDLTELSSERVDLISTLLPALGEAAAARNLMSESMPSVFDLNIERPFESWVLLGCFNWAGRKRALNVPLGPGRWHVFEFWEQQYYGAHEGNVELEDVPSHGVRLLALRRSQEVPQLLATTFHVSMGGCEIDELRFDAEEQMLRIGLKPVGKQEGELFIHVPPGYRFTKATLNGGPLAQVRQDGALVILSLGLHRPSAVALIFRRT